MIHETVSSALSVGFTKMIFSKQATLLSRKYAEYAYCNEFEI